MNPNRSPEPEFSYADFVMEWESGSVEERVNELRLSVEAAVRAPLQRAFAACATRLGQWGHALEEAEGQLDPTGFSWLCSRYEGAPRLRIALDYLATVGFELPRTTSLDEQAITKVRACIRAVCDGPLSSEETERLTGITPAQLEEAALTWPACNLPPDDASDVAVCVLAMLLLYPATRIDDLESQVGASEADLRQLLETLPGATLDPWLESQPAETLTECAPTKSEASPFENDEFGYARFVSAWRRGHAETVEAELQRVLSEQVRGSFARSLDPIIDRLKKGGHRLQKETGSSDDVAWVATSAPGTPRLRVALSYYISVRFEGAAANDDEAALVLTHLDDDAIRIVRRCLREGCASLLPRWLCESLLLGSSFEDIELASHHWPRSGLSPSDTLHLGVEILTVLFRDPEIDVRMLEQVVEASEEELRELLVRLSRARPN